MLKVTVIGPSKKFLSGVSYYTIRLSNALSEFADVNAILFRHMLPKRLFPGWKRVGEELTKLKFVEKVKVYEILDWYNPLTWIRAYRIARESDAIIMQWWTSSVAHMYASIELLNKISNKIPIVIEFHEVVDPLENSILPIRVYSRLMGKLIRKFATHYVVHSEVDKILISKIYGIPDQCTTVIPHGVYDHYERFENAKEKLGISEEFVILFFGLLRPYKGVKYLIEAFDNLPEDIANKSRLLIVGETWEDRESIRLAQRSKYNEKITIVNRYVSDSEVSLYFSASDVLVLPYTRASQSGVAHIAMAFGLPIIATKVGGLEEALSNYGCAHFIEPRNVESLANALKKLYTTKPKKCTPPKNLTWENIALSWIKLITNRR